MTALEQGLRLHGETALYVLFFGLLLVLGIAETRRRLGNAALARRRRWPVNWGLTALNIVLLGALPVTALTVADFSRDANIGLFNNIALPAWAAIAAGMLVRSFSAWAVHLAMHKVPLLWRVHKVHHCDREMDISTTVRFHPLEFAIQVPVTLGVVVLFGIPPVAILLFEFLDAAVAVFSHANVRLGRRTERVLGWFIVTPGLHRVHHSAWQPQTDSNYGATLTVWDRLFGTYRREDEATLAALRIGLDDVDDPASRNLWRQLTLPFVRPTMAGSAAATPGAAPAAVQGEPTP